MANIPQKVSERLIAGIKKFKLVLDEAQKNKDNESNTVIIITDMLSEIFGYAKYSEITSEIAIRGTFCDLATQIDNKIQSLIEAKAICHELNDAHITQAVGYASTKGIEWVVLTNGKIWQIYKVTIDKLVDHEKIIEIDFLNVDHHNPDHLESLFCLTKEGWMKSALNDYYEQRQALSKFSIGAVLLTEPVLTLIKRELKHVSPDVKIDIDQIRKVLEQEVIKPDVVDCDKAKEAAKKIAKAANKAMKSKMEKDSAEDTAVQTPPPPPISPTATVVSNLPAA